jgi:predicted SPOUT superfamily RNA methylase MTH1
MCLQLPWRCSTSRYARNGVNRPVLIDHALRFSHLAVLLAAPDLGNCRYMRKALFPRHKDLRLAGLLSALDAPHHVRKTEWTPYREGVIVKKPLGAQGGSLVNCGLVREVRISQSVMTGVRVTVRLDETEAEWSAIERCERGTARVHKGVAVSPGTPRAVDGTYWGYVVRMASGLGEVFTGCPFKGGYDVSVGVAERGTESVDEPASLEMPKYKHALIVFGGADGLDEALAAEEADTATGLGLEGDDVSSLFDHWFNPLPDLGSRSTRTEVRPSLLPFMHWKWLVRRAFQHHLLLSSFAIIVPRRRLCWWPCRHCVPFCSRHTDEESESAPAPSDQHCQHQRLDWHL